jgi:hypothetical protein
MVFKAGLRFKHAAVMSRSASKADVEAYQEGGWFSNSAPAPHERKDCMKEKD